MIGLGRRLLPGSATRHPVPGTQRDALGEASRASEDRFRAGTEDFDARFYQSIRFKLTAWYASVLILVLVAFGVALHMLLEQALDQDVERRLLAARDEIIKQTGVIPSQVGAPQGSQTRVVFDADPPELGSILLSGLWVSIYDAELGDYEATAGALSKVPDTLDAAIRNEGLLDIVTNRFTSLEIDGSTNRVLAQRIFVSTENGEVEVSTDKVILIGESLGSRDRIMSLINQVLQIAGAIGIALAAWGGWLLAGRVLSPVERLTRTADAIGSGDGRVSLSHRLEVPRTGDELSRLAMTFNTMLDRIEAAFMAQRRFVSDASHELRTPLTSIRGNVDVLQRQLRSGRPMRADDIAEALGDIQRESARMGRLIEDLLVLARNDAAALGYLLKPEPVSLDVIANEAYRTALALVKGQHLTLTTRDEVMVHGDGDRLVQVMLILIDNALRHTPAGGSVELRVGRAVDERENIPCALIEVEDAGQGISVDHLPHLFQRFYRSESARSRPSGGTGLGLSIALAIVRGHHGWIDVETAPGRGTTFSVWLPLMEFSDAQRAAEPALQATTDARHAGRVPIHVP